MSRPISRIARLAAAALLLVAAASVHARAALAQTAAPVDATRDASHDAAHHLAVASHALPRGAVLTADDITYRDSTAQPVGAAPVAAGWVARRSILAGEVLRVPAVAAPTVVSANQMVELEYADQNLRLIVQGTATRSAALGERVAVRTAMGHRVDGTVVAPGHVRID